MKTEENWETKKERVRVRVEKFTIIYSMLLEKKEREQLCDIICVHNILAASAMIPNKV